MIYQIYYKENQKDQLDPGFVPYDNTGKLYPYNYEYAVFFDIYKKTTWSEIDLLGTVSWKFKHKTGLSATEFTEHILNNPGHDVYFVNPFPFLCIYKSVWEQGEKYHPGLTGITSDLLKAVGYSDEILYKETPPNLTAYCNYWVANKKFWDAYILYLTPIWNYIIDYDNSLTAILKKNADPDINAPYLPFIFERLFSSFVATNNWSVSSMVISEEKLKESRYLRPIYKNVLRVSAQQSYQNIKVLDKAAIKTMSFLRKYIGKIYF